MTATTISAILDADDDKKYDVTGSDYRASEESSEDDEETIAQQEEAEVRESDKGNEIEDLEAEQDVPLDELIARYLKKREQLTDGESEVTGTGSSELEEEVEDEDSNGEEADEEATTAPSSAKEIDEELGV